MFQNISRKTLDSVDLELSKDEEVLVKVAWLYYFENMTQQEIANKLNLSRPKVGRLLVKARQEGIVSIQLSPKVKSLNLALENELETRFDLKEAVVVDSGEDRDSLYRNLGRGGAHFLDRSLCSDFMLGLAMGSSIAATVPYITPRIPSNGTIITLSGGFTQPGHDTSGYNVGWPMAEKLGARLEQLFCPLVAESKETREVILKDANLRSQLVRAGRVDMALVSLGYVHHAMPLHRLGFCSKDDIDKLLELGAVGEIITSFFDLDGNAVRSDLDDRIIGLTINELVKIPTTVAISGGLEKTKAILGALRVKCLDVIITDQKTTEAVLKLDDKTRK
jgi:DNA-binding transcriptional regulator LsrR (DeoR family)